MADVNGLVADPQFQKLDPASQRQALAGVTGDQSFVQLSDADTSAFVSRMAPDKTAESLSLVSPEGKDAFAKKNAYGLPGAMEPVDARSRQAMLTPQNQQRYASGTRMAVPAFLMSLGAMGPVGAIERQGVRQGLTTLGKQALRTVAGTYVGSDLGGKAGGMIDQITGSKAGIGQEVGRLAGGAYGGYKLSSDPELLARVPFLGRFLTSPEEYAGSLATQRVANQIAMEKAVAQNPDAQERALGSFMNRGYRSMAPEAPEPSMLGGTATNALPASANAMQLPTRSTDSEITTTGPKLPFLRSAEPAVTPDAAPLRPTIGTPEEWNAYDQRMQNLKAEASDAGTYSAARGKVGKKLNYQQRIGKNF